MYNINMYEFQDKAYCNSGEYYIYPLNHSGIEKYNSKEGHPALYLNRLNPTIFQQIISKVPSDKTEALNSKSKVIEANKSCQSINVSLTEMQNKLHSNASTLNDNANGNTSINANINATNAYQYKKKPCKYNAIALRAKGTYIKPFEVRLKEQRKYFQALHKKMDFEDIFGYSQPIKKQTRADVYENKITVLKENLSSNEIKEGNSNTGQCIRKAINGGFVIPRFNEYKERANESYQFTALTTQLNRSLSIPHNKVLNKQESINVLRKNNDLKQTLDQQTNKVYLKKTKLPPLKNVLSTKQVMSQVINGKSFGLKYNPYSDFNQNTNARNYIGGKFNH